MKLRRNFLVRILASLMLLTSSLPCAFNGQAQITYRGFVEGGLGLHFGEADLAYMLATTHGIQLKNNFFGLGLGIMPEYNYYDYDRGTDYNPTVSIYANWRYDFFRSNWPLKPFVGIKAGCQTSDDALLYDALLYIAADFGLRKRLSKSSGLSFGLSLQSCSESWSSINSYYNDYEVGLDILAKVVFDF